MGFSLLKDKFAKKRDQVLAVDLGSRITKAVHVQRRNGGFALGGYALLDAPIFEREMSAELLAEHLTAVAQTFQGKTKLVALTVGSSEAIVRPVDVPRLPLDELRPVLRHNSRAYLQQDLSGHVFDGHVLLSYVEPAPGKLTQASSGLQKQRVLVAAAKKQLVDLLAEGARGAGLVPDCVVPGLIGPVNAFEMAMPAEWHGESVALVDIGFKGTSICILHHGELQLNRIVGLGADRLTVAVSEALKVSYAEAEGIKVGLPQEVEQALDMVLVPLGRELRASIDFFEHQQDKTVSRVLISGGSARSEAVLRKLQNELAVECKTWDPTSFLEAELSPQQAAELPEVGPQLGVAVGTALAAL